VTLQNAITQAQSELILALSSVVPIDNIPDFSALSVYNINPENDIGNAYLLALSTAFYKYAELKANDQDTSADAQLSLILNQIAVDFADDGIIEQPGFDEDLTEALRKLNPKAITDNLVQRSSIDFSDYIDIPDITRFFGLCAGAADCMWSSRAPMPAPTRGHASAVYQGKIYIFGGNTPDDYTNEYDFEPISTAYTGVYEYDPETNQWSQKQPMPIGLYDLTAHTIGDKIYIFGGYGDGGFINSVMQYDPVNNTWSQKTSMPTYRYIFMSEVVDGKVFVIGGHGTIDDGPWESGKAWEYKSHVEIYNPETDSWSNGSSAPSNVAGGASCSINGNIYILGGYDAGNLESNTYVYNTATDIWSARSPASIARKGHSCVTIGNNFYLMGGNNSQEVLDTLEVYSTEMDQWNAITYLPTARYSFSANPIGSSIYIFGGVGSDFNTQINSVEVLDTLMME
jgi:N-acetylneuraminic acid mutarotase